ncbi:DUF3060 domain-containing protein [Microbacterium binotii]|uniref:DUF3060 domain-containing protein n=1 Tax=Microbacterium binotii TaxID=462710 RepID=UPI001F3F7861|nr:DUF3060 domain-containing protein [Microbacterium binotii]UIN32051.1 DUF3060 domain-containing protein [Microbacterium binotii]
MTPRRLGQIAILVAAAAVLTGCGVVAGPRQTVLPEPPNTAPSASSAPAGSPTSSPSAPSPGADGQQVLCGSGTTEISGADRDVALTGECVSVMIGGTGLRVDATQAALGVVQLSGDRNDLRASDISDLSVGGQDNVVDAGTLSTVSLNGDRNALTAAGFGALVVSGNDNTVHADSQGAVTDNGQRNTVTGR